MKNHSARWDTYNDGARANLVVIKGLSTGGDYSILNVDENGVPLTFLDYSCIAYCDGDYEYYCYALPGTAVDTAAWKIQRIDNTGGTYQSTKWAEGSLAFDKRADLHATYSYS